MECAPGAGEGVSNEDGTSVRNGGEVLQMDGEGRYTNLVCFMPLNCTCLEAQAQEMQLRGKDLPSTCKALSLILSTYLKRKCLL